MLRAVFQNSLNSYNRFYVHYRLVRSVARRNENRPKLLKGNVVTLDNDVGDMFGPVEEYADLNRVLSKMFTDPEEIEDESDEMLEGNHNYNTVIEKSGQYAQMHDQEEKDYRRYVRRKITERKIFKDIKETNLLTYSAKQQIRYLHALDKKEWTLERISECFPISVQGAKKLLKNNFEFKHEEQIKKHDHEVAERWKMLEDRQNLSSFSPVTLQLWREGKLVGDYYSGNVNLPQPLNPKKELKTKPKKVGEHLAIVKKYLDIKKSSEIVKTDTNFSCKTQDNDEKTVKEVLPHLHFQRPSDNDIEDRTFDSFLASKKVEKFDTDIPCEQYKENLLHEYSSKEKPTETDAEYLEWLKNMDSTEENRNNPSIETNDVFLEIVKKHDIESVELIRGDNRDNQNVPYIYDSEKGYQYPLGKNVIPIHIKIPKQLVKKGLLYKIGQCYYDDTGEFLYKIPLNIKKD